MKAGIGIAILLALVLTLVFASVALATSQATIDKIINDARDGTIDGTYSAADIQAALDYARANPDVLQYSNAQGVLEDYLASLQSPGAASAGELKFTGGELLMVFAAGAGLIGSGTLLRRRRD
jgi:hypothetical protein